MIYYVIRLRHILAGCHEVCVEGFMCLTNTTSNTAFRGFGGPQGLLLAEQYVVHMASALKLTPEEMRRRNSYALDGDARVGG